MATNKANHGSRIMPQPNDATFLNISDSNPDSKQTPRYESFIVKPKKFNVKNLGNDDIDLDQPVE